MYQGLTFECIVLILLPFGRTFLNLCCCAMRSVNLCHEFQRIIAVHQTMCTSKKGTAMANCLRHFSVHDKVPSSIFACSSFSTRCPSQKYLLQKARQLSLGVRFLTGAASWVSSPLGSWCLGLRADMAARDGDRAAGGGLGLLWSVCRGRGGAFPIDFAR